MIKTTVVFGKKKVGPQEFNQIVKDKMSEQVKLLKDDPLLFAFGYKYDEVRHKSNVAKELLRYDYELVY